MSTTTPTGRITDTERTALAELHGMSSERIGALLEDHDAGAQTRADALAYIAQVAASETPARTVDLTYDCTVHVTVDLETGEVQSVNVDDENTTLSKTDRESSDADTAAARKIADSASWPAWEFGF